VRSDLTTAPWPSGERDGSAAAAGRIEEREVRAGPPGWRAFHSLVERVRDDIFQRRLRPGDQLPRERALAEEFGISRAAVREALRVLEMQGLVRVRHGYRGGVFVAEPGTEPLLGALDTSLRLDSVGLDELYEARRVIEPMLARVAMERDAASLSRLLEANISRAVAELGAGGNLFEVNAEFHAILARAGGNRVLNVIMQAILELLREGRQRDVPDLSLSSGALDDHRQILAAIEAKEGRLVEALMVTHLTRVHEQFSPERRPSDPTRPREAACRPG
jgi:GntR family transcriptional regulator, transcriptional repressor for pyruvate dehydrogenase complex